MSEQVEDTTDEATEAPDAADNTSETEAETETFGRPYVEQLRNENAKYRQRAQQADTYAQRLHAELVRATGRLADATDLPFAEEHLETPEALAAALDDLLTKKPHLAARRPAGDIGQGQTRTTATVNLAEILRGSR